MKLFLDDDGGSMVRADQGNPVNTALVVVPKGTKAVVRRGERCPHAGRKNKKLYFIF